MEKKDLLHTIPPEVWEKEWNANIQSVGSGRNTIKYLSRYVFKIAISDHRIIKVHSRRVYFKYTDRKGYNNFFGCNRQYEVTPVFAISRIS